MSLRVLPEWESMRACLPHAEAAIGTDSRFCWLTGGHDLARGSHALRQC
jgi:hypothetical protein